MKAHKVAHIVPVECLEKTKDNQYHMCLAHLVKQSKVYADFFRRMSDEGKFVLMDNGAAEGEQLSIDQLVECYDVVRPTQIVLPDTLLDGHDTLRKHLDGLSYLHGYYGEKLPFEVMGVPQGHDLIEWTMCMKAMLELKEISCLGVSKFLEMETGDKTIRCDAVDAIASVTSDVEIHLLGCSDGSAVVRRIFEKYPKVRGCDSAFVYLASQAGVEIGLDDVDRPSGEIDFLSGADYDSLNNNMEMFNKLVGVKDNGKDDTWLVD